MAKRGRKPKLHRYKHHDPRRQFTVVIDIDAPLLLACRSLCLSKGMGQICHDGKLKIKNCVVINNALRLLHDTLRNSVDPATENYKLIVNQGEQGDSNQGTSN